jgi:hypothetical protein
MRFDQDLQMWVTTTGSYYPADQQAAAEAEEKAATEGRQTDADVSFRQQANPGSPWQFEGVQGAGEVSTYTAEQRAAFERQGRPATVSGFASGANRRNPAVGGARTPGNIGGATGAYNAVSDRGRAAFDYHRDLTRSGVVSPGTFLNQLGEDAGASHVGDVLNPARVEVYSSPEDMLGTWHRRINDPERGLGATVGGTGGLPLTSAVQMGIIGDGTGAAGDGGADGTGGPGGPPTGAPGAGRTGIDDETQAAENAADEAIQGNRDENAQLFADAFQQYDDLQPSDYAGSNEARGYQREALAQQRMLLERMLGFDADQYATRYADQALARQIAAGRSAGGGYASQQAGMFAAMEQAPALYAEGARQAANVESQRLAGAQQAAKTFGDIATMTRGQDEARAQFESNLGLQIADSVARLTEGNVQMNDRDSQMMAQIWMDFAKLQSVYEGMTSDEMIAWWQQETARRGQDQNFEAIMAQLKAQGQVSSKDLIGGLFQLGGGLLGVGGQIGGAYMQGQTARDVARINNGIAA